METISSVYHQAIIPANDTPLLRCVILNGQNEPSELTPDVDASGRCCRHRNYALSRDSACQGMGKNAPCRREALRGEMYCSVQHDPLNFFPSPSEFKHGGATTTSSSSTTTTSGTITTGSTDDYHPAQDPHVNFIVEPQVAASVFGWVLGASPDHLYETATILDMIELVRSIINDVSNLVPAADKRLAKVINRAKTSAMTDFLVPYNFNQKPTTPLGELLAKHFKTAIGMYSGVDAWKLARAVMDDMQIAFLFINETLQAELRKCTTATAATTTNTTSTTTTMTPTTTTTTTTITTTTTTPHGEDDRVQAIGRLIHEFTRIATAMECDAPKAADGGLRTDDATRGGANGRSEWCGVAHWPRPSWVSLCCCPPLRGQDAVRASL